MKPDKRLILSLTPFLFLFMASCNSNDAEQSSDGFDSTIAESRQIVFTQEQFQNAEMKIGRPELFSFQQTVSARGYVSASPAGFVRISTLIPGKISQIKTRPGQFIQKGQILFTLEGNEIVALQQQYAEAFHELKSIEANYQRQKALFEEDVAAKKSFINAESEYLSLLAHLEGFKTKLKLINIDPQKIESGKIVTWAAVLSPIQGHITKQELVLGQFIEPHETVLEIVDTKKLQLELNIFEKDLQELLIGQEVVFYKPDRRINLFKGKLISLGKSIDPETKTVKCIAGIDDIYLPELVNNLYVEATIITCQREAMAIPDQAIIEEEGKYYILKLSAEHGDSLVFQKSLTSIGVIQQDHAEILEEGLENILIQGLFNISYED